MTECPKCGSKEIGVNFRPVGDKVFWDEHKHIAWFENFTNNDRYYTSDTIKKECLIYTCKTCNFRIALKTKDSQ